MQINQPQQLPPPEPFRELCLQAKVETSQDPFKK